MHKTACLCCLNLKESDARRTAKFLRILNLSFTHKGLQYLLLPQFRSESESASNHLLWNLAVNIVTVIIIDYIYIAFILVALAILIR